MKAPCVRLISTSLILLLLLSSIAAIGLRPWSMVYAAGTVSGTVFADYNSDGIRDANEPGLGGITVTAYDSAGVMRGTTTSDPTGSYILNATGTGPYRIEFSGWPAYLQPARSGAGNGTSVQFVPDGTSTNVNFGLHNPAAYCQDNPNIASSCYSNGDPLGDPTGLTYSAAERPALVQIPFVPDTAGPDDNQYLATGAQVGATWGLTYQRSSQTLLAAAVVRRHSGFGPGGIGAIYAVDPSGSTAPRVLLDLNTDGYPAGTGVGTLNRPDLPADSTETNHDTDAFDAVGKRGIGGIALSEDEETLWVMNLYSRSLLEIRVGVPATAPTAADITVHPMPNPGCTSGIFRPWAVTTHRGQVYIGGVCSGELPYVGKNTNTSHLRAYIYRHDPTGVMGNFDLIYDFPLDYPRGFISTDVDFPPLPPQVTQSPLATWLPWINEWDDIGPPSPLPGGGPFGQTMYPQPILSAIEFDADGSMVLGLLDRAGMQLGNENYSPIPGDTTLYEGVAASDILRLCVDPASGYVLENNGMCPGEITGTGTGNNQGPGGGEFFGEDDYILLGNPLHQEVTLGGLALHPGRSEVVSIAYDPVRVDGDLRSGGFRWFDTTNGTLDRSYLIFGRDEVIGTGTPRQPSSMGKAAGLGDIELLCDQAPIEIGNRVWLDLNGDGIQDPDEEPIEGVRVELWRDGTLIGFTTTDANGEYYFRDDILPRTGTPGGDSAYEIRIPADQPALDELIATRANADPAPNGDSRDSNGILENTNVVYRIPYGDLAGAGYNNHTYDFGFTLPASLGDYVWEDRNRDGIQDDDEPPVTGVRVILRDTDGNPIRETTTNDQGYYFFGDLVPGSYQVEFVLPDGYQFTLPQQGTDDERDSDADPDTGRTRVVELAPGEHNPRLDAGLYRPASLGDYVWEDRNRDGIQDDDEPGVPGVIVRLLDGNGEPVRNPDGTPRTVTTDAEGRYQFTDLPPGTYQVEFVLPDGYAFTLPNQGDDNTRDSDADPTTERTSVIRLRSDEENRTVDAGIYRLPILGNLVWEDANNNGVVDPGETGVPDVPVRLYRASGDGQPDGPPVAETITDMNGNYRFSGMPAGEYIVDIVPPEDYRSSTGRNGHEAGPYEPGYTPGVDGNPARRNVDHGTEVRPGLIRSNPITFTPDGDPAENGDLTIDFGIFRPASLGNIVWHDQNNNGQRDPGEPGISGVTVTLYDQDGNIVATTTTDADGNYLFTHLTPGIYQVGFELPEGYAFTIPGQGDPATDSDVDPDTRRTGPVSIEVGQNELTIWAGLITPDPADVPDPTAITLNRFTATREDGRVVIRWETGVERNTWGYQLYRATSRDRAQATRITPTIILARGRGANGAAYIWHDTEASDAGDYWYWLEEVEIDGTTSIHGPIRISTQTATTTFKVFLPLTVR